MLGSNRAAVGLATRAQVQRWRVDLLDEATAELVLRALSKSRDATPAGWVFTLAEAMGATRSRAFAAGTVAELFHAAVDLIDDIQDDDVAYLSDVSPALQINTAFHLVALSSVMAAQLDPGLPGTMNALFARMLTGQAREILRGSWTPQAYVDVSDRIGGRQMAVYLHAASAAAQTDPECLLGLADPLALLIMIHHDRASMDERLLCFRTEDVDAMQERAQKILQQARERVPAIARPFVDALASSAMK
jgi:hypothetical protein